MKKVKMVYNLENELAMAEEKLVELNQMRLVKQERYARVKEKLETLKQESDNASIEVETAKRDFKTALQVLEAAQEKSETGLKKLTNAQNNSERVTRVFAHLKLIH